MSNTCKADESPEFIAFWSIWQPRSRNTDGRGLARETFRRRVLKGANPQDIVDGASWFVRNLTDKTNDYVPLSATWLNRETYDGLCDKERAYQEHIKSAQQQTSTVVPILGKRPAFAVQYERERNQEQAS